RGKVGMGTKEEDFVEKIFIASTHQYLLIFTSLGKVYWLKVYQVPQAGRAAKGKAIVNLVNTAPGERVAAILPVKDFVQDRFIVMAMKKGIIKKTVLTAYANPRSGGIIAVNIDPDDELIDVQLTLGSQDIFLGTRKGKAICFHESDVRPTGRVSRGVTGIRIAADDVVIGMEIPTEGNTIVTVSEKGFGKRTYVAEYPVHGRGGHGVVNLKTVPKVGGVSSLMQMVGNEDLILMSNAGKIIRLKVEEVPLLHRASQGVKLIELDEEEKLVGVARAEREEDITRDDEDVLEEEGPDDDFPDTETLATPYLPGLSPDETEDGDE
ncbi:MAG: DNA gyrase C-terminal beta-propeller domain-containing protein, partial [Syntrophales bacterium]|nr:DNA gyrase C-terminal beta-propeller domain-containing protein [Syntrophales bacterium]